MTKSFISTVETSFERGEGPATTDRAKEHSNNNGQLNSTLQVLASSRGTLQADPDLLVKMGTPDTAGTIPHVSRTRHATAVSAVSYIQAYGRRQDLNT